MIDIETKATLEALEDLDDLLDGLDDLEGRGRESIKAHIAETATEEIESTVERRARQIARNHIGDHADEIEGRVLGFVGRTFQAGLDTDSEVVLAHEYGSGRYGPDGQSYRIDPADGPLAFEVDGVPIVVDYVVHPGVEGKFMMRRAVRETREDLRDALEDDLLELLREELRTAGR